MIILSDNNPRGAVNALRLLIEREWADCVAAFELRFMQLEEVGLNSRSSDTEIYVKCLAIDALLVTSDKTTHDGDDSLEQAIRRLCREDSPPVITIVNQVRVLKDAEYQDQCVFDLIDCISSIDNHRGIGRVHIPYQWTGASC